MRISKLFMLAVLFAVLSMSMAAEAYGRHDEPQALPKDSAKFIAGDGGSPFFGSRARVLSNYYRPYTCDNYPGICRAWGSAGPDCCRKHCVDMSTDIFNCGRCGRMCRYGKVCCRGSCVNVLYDGYNCGACGHRCKKGSYCLYGMCSYA